MSTRSSKRTRDDASANHGAGAGAQANHGTDALYDAAVTAMRSYIAVADDDGPMRLIAVLEAMGATVRTTDSNPPNRVERSGVGVSEATVSTAEHIEDVANQHARRVISWNDWEEVGDESNLPKYITRVPGLSVSAITFGPRHAVAIDVQGSVFSWGRGVVGIGDVSHLSKNHHGDPFSPAPIKVAMPEAVGRVAAVSCGSSHSVILTSDGQVFAWGWALNGTLGIGDVSHLPKDNDGFSFSLAPIEVAMPQAVGRVAAVSCGSSHNVILTSDGKVFAWGSARHGQLGIGDVSHLSQNHNPRHPFSPAPIEVAMPEAVGRVAAVSCGKNHSVVLTSDGKVFAWGLAMYGTLGIGDVSHLPIEDNDGFSFSSAPIEVAMPEAVGRVVAVSCGSGHSVVLTSDGQVFAWGSARHGQLGIGDVSHLPKDWVVHFADVPVAMKLPPCERVVSCVATAKASIILTQSGKVFSCGQLYPSLVNNHDGPGSDGGDGNGGVGGKSTLQTISVPTEMALLSKMRVVSIHAGGGVAVSSLKTPLVSLALEETMLRQASTLASKVTDVVVRVGGTTVAVHGFVARLISPFFAAALSGKFGAKLRGEGGVTIVDLHGFGIEAEAVRTVFRWAVTGSLCESGGVEDPTAPLKLLQVLQCNAVLRVPLLQETVLSRLRATMVENADTAAVITFWDAAMSSEASYSDELQELAERCMRARYAEFKADKAWVTAAMQRPELTELLLTDIAWRAGVSHGTDKS